MGKLCTLLSCAVLLVATGYAQDDPPRHEVFFGYSHDNADVGKSGWDGAYSYNATRMFSIDADVSGHYGDEDILLASVESNVHHFHVAPRVNVRTEDDRFAAFGRVLLGLSRNSASITGLPGLFDDTDTSFSWGLGAGADFNFNRSFGARAKADWIRSSFFDDSQNHGRYTIGVMYRWGGEDF